MTRNHRHLCLVMVGLPGRGKSFISRKLECFMQWRDGGHSAKLFSIRNYRRGATAMGQADFFDPDNATALEQQQQFAEAAMEDMLQFFEEGGEVGIFDATNSTNDRRKWIEAKCHTQGVAVVFIESICDLPHVLEENYRNKVKHSPDYAGVDFNTAIADLKGRIANYERMYETITDEGCTYFKLHNLQSKVMCNKAYGSLTKSLLPFLTSINITPRPIWLCRSGNPIGDETTHDEENNPTAECRLAPLSKEGQEFATALGKFLEKHCAAFYGTLEVLQSRDGSLQRMHSVVTTSYGEVLENAPCKLMVSTLPRSIQTVAETSPDYDVELWSQLNPMNKGIFDRMLLKDIRTKDPEWYQKFQTDRLKTRFPGGESYSDLVKRLEPCLIEAEQQTAPVLICSHITALQVLYAYFRQIPIEQAIRFSFERHAVYQFTPQLGGMYHLDIFRLVNGPDGPALEESVPAPVSPASSSSV
eukprot:GGOE01013982.1.p1 GENE.GGOE01013982.1~~GGOE01013982.1.p1  ORF type:complete len:529 (+),score=170.55 GGOE01013982.1:170-1588(+)